MNVSKTQAIVALAVMVGGALFSTGQFVNQHFASADDLSEATGQIAGNSIAILYVQLDNLLRVVAQHKRLGEPIPFDLKRRVQDVCVKIQQSGGATPAECRLG